MIVALNYIALPSEKGTGAYHYIQNLVKVMSEYAIKDTHFIVYKQQQISERYLCLPEDADVEYINVPTLGNGWKRILFEQTLFYRYIKPCDVFYSYCTSMPLFVKAKRIFTLHDVYYLTTPQRYGWLQRTYLTWITRCYIRQANTILTVSEFSKQEIEKYIPAARGKVEITYNILPCDNIREIQNIYQEDLPYFLFIGSIQPGKNIIGMIDGFEQFNKDGKYNLVVVGKPANNSAPIMQKIHNSANVVYFGYRTDEEIKALYKGAEAVVLLSFCEGFGIPPLEGFRYGKPALVSNATSLPEVVGKAGIQVDPNDIAKIANGFKQILQQKEVLSTQIENQLKKFDKNTSTEKWMQILQIQYAKK